MHGAGEAGCEGEMAKSSASAMLLVKPFKRQPCVNPRAVDFKPEVTMPLLGLEPLCELLFHTEASIPPVNLEDRSRS